MTLPDNFWSKARRTDCLLWQGAVNSKGYACFAVDGKSQLAHRLVFEDAHGPIPEGMTIDHTCRTRNCVNVDHLELVTTAENNGRALVAAGYGIGGQCGRGHDLTNDSTTRSRRGRLICLACAREHTRAHDAAAALARGEVPAQVIRDWAREAGIPVSARGRLSPKLRALYAASNLADTG